MLQCPGTCLPAGHARNQRKRSQLQKKKKKEEEGRFPAHPQLREGTTSHLMVL